MEDIEITPEMIEAEAKVYNDWYDNKIKGVITERDLVEAVYQSMESIRGRDSQQSQ